MSETPEAPTTPTNAQAWWTFTKELLTAIGIFAGVAWLVVSNLIAIRAVLRAYLL